MSCLYIHKGKPPLYQASLIAYKVYCYKRLIFLFLESTWEKQPREGEGL